LFEEFPVKTNYVRNEYDNCVYKLNSDEKFIVQLLLCVDDILMTSYGKNEIGKLKRKLHVEFEMKDLGTV
jgi:hypothetical protein